MEEAPEVTRTATAAWTAALICLCLTWLALTGLQFGPGATTISLRLLFSGIAFTAAAIYVRRRWGGLALAGFFAVAVASLAAVHGGAFAKTMDLFEYRLGALAAVVLLTPSLGLVALTLHRLAGRPSRILERDLPIGLAVFAVTQVIALVLALAVASVTIPTVKS